MTDAVLTTSVNSLLTSWTDRLAGSGSRVRVAFADGDDERVRRAAQVLPGLGVDPVLISRTGEVSRDSGVEVVEVQELAVGEPGRRVAELGRQRGWTEAVIAVRRQDPAYLAAACVETGEAEACVAGAGQPTGEVLRAGLHVLGLATGAELVSSSFLLQREAGETLGFGDCAVVPEPSSEQLADIAAATADTYRALTGKTPYVAMLSFSTHGSADHESARHVRRATALVRERRPDLHVDGELQLDAALDAAVGSSKAAGSTVAGRANVLIFPNLAAGNIGYKIAQRLGGAAAFGPIIQGLAGPMNDLSRGCSIDDVINVAVISALQARSQALARPSSPS